MPNRIIKESINTSQTMNSLSAEAERHWYRLLTKADDYGCFEATPEVVRGGCYVWQLDNISAEDVFLWQYELEQNGLIGYWKDGKRIYGCFLSFDEHNSKYSVTDSGKSTRHRRKTPEPPATFDSLCHLLPTFASLCQNCEPLPNPNPNPNPEEDFSIEKSKAAAFVSGENLNKSPAADEKVATDWQIKCETVVEHLKKHHKFFGSLDKNTLYQIAGKCLKTFRRDPDIVLQVFGDCWQVILAIDNQEDLFKYLNGVKRGTIKRGDWGFLESKAHKAGWEKTKGPQKLGDILGNVIGGNNRSP